jgi:hypothetical protein
MLRDQDYGVALPEARSVAILDPPEEVTSVLSGRLWHKAAFFSHRAQEDAL